MNCPICNKDVPEKSIFCPHCGQVVSQVTSQSGSSHADIGNYHQDQTDTYWKKVRQEDYERSTEYKILVEKRKHEVRIRKNTTIVATLVVFSVVALSIWGMFSKINTEKTPQIETITPQDELITLQEGIITPPDEFIIGEDNQQDFFVDTDNPFGQKYWVIFKEWSRNGRIEASSIDSSLPPDSLHFIWDTSIVLNNTSESNYCNQYYLTPTGNWGPIGTYSRPTDCALEVLASNLDVYDAFGNIVIKKCSYKDIDLSHLEHTNVSADIPVGALSWNDHSYFVFDNCSSWEEAAEYCKSRGGHLATITSADENAVVYAYIDQCGYKSAYFGLSDSMNEGTWLWITGESTIYLNWHSGEPNGESSVEDYAMFYYKFNDGTWNDGEFGNGTVNGGTAFICEWE